MSPPLAQPLLALAALGLALALQRRRAGAHAPRFAASLLAGALLMHLGLALALSAAPREALGAGAVSLLFLPLGPLLLARDPASFAALPLPIALARLGCVAAGCCRGELGVLLPWLDAAAFAALHGLCGRVPPARVEGTFLTGFGAIRLLETPWRGGGGGPVPPLLVAAAWLALGLAHLLRVPASVTES